MFYESNTFKPISDPGPYHPQNLDETRGVPLRVFIKDDFCIAVFAWGMVAFPEELREKLAPLVGRTVAILRLDGRGGPAYHCRAIK
ncbi:MAG: hypothetical protein NTU95_05600 [Methanothrix sp.]|nr:hypothetical protein [Methanothrix sp.]